MNSEAMQKVSIALPSDSLRIVSELVKKLGGQLLKSNPETEIIYVTSPLPDNERVGRLLRGARVRAGMTQKQLAEAIKVPQSHVSGYEKNKRPIPPHKAEELAKVLNTVSTHFLTREVL